MAKSLCAQLLERAIAEQWPLDRLVTEAEKLPEPDRNVFDMSLARAMQRWAERLRTAAT
jgi:hypothetical protein